MLALLAVALGLDPAHPRARSTVLADEPHRLQTGLELAPIQQAPALALEHSEVVLEILQRPVDPLHLGLGVFFVDAEHNVSPLRVPGARVQAQGRVEMGLGLGQAAELEMYEAGGAVIELGGDLFVGDFIHELADLDFLHHVPHLARVGEVLISNE